MNAVMTDPLACLHRAISLMREAQDSLDRGGHAAIAAHLETALGFAEAEAARVGAPLSARP